ncbi:MAG: FeoB-associated Cys-rich membrane protein [Clostridia bacterium]|nr:FeoB-associated Cys-rich membrane protein [Clostridia bacterium]
MNAVDIILIVLVAAALTLAIRSMKKRRGCCRCEGCSMCGKACKNKND